jgi:hypothetical protein
MRLAQQLLQASSRLFPTKIQAKCGTEDSHTDRNSLDASLNDPEDEIESSSLSYRGSFALRTRTPSLRRAVSGSRASGNGRSLRRSGGSGADALPPGLNVAEMSAYAQSNEAVSTRFYFILILK